MAGAVLELPAAEEQGTGSVARSPRRRTTLALAALGLSVLAAEVVLQVLCLVVAPLDAALRPAWAQASIPAEAPPPNLPDAVLGVRGNPAFPEHDAEGFRNSPATTSAAIVALGDSQTYGSMVGRDEAWPAVLARQSASAVHSLAFGAWGPWEYSQMLDRALALKPETVLVGVYLGNDLYDAYRAAYVEHRAAGWAKPELAEAMAAREKAGSPDRAAARLFAAAPPATPPSPATVRGWISTHVRLYGLARAVKDALLDRGRANGALQVDDWDAVVAWAARRPELCRVLDVPGRRTILTSAYRAQALDLGDARVAEGLRLATSALSDMAERSRAAGVELVVVLIPTKESVFAPPGDAVTADLMAKERAAAAALRSVLAGCGVRVVDVRPALQACLEAGVQPYPISADGHPNPAGHRAIAIAVASAL